MDVPRRHPQQHLAGAAQLAELLEDEPDDLGEPPIRIESEADVPIDILQSIERFCRNNAPARA